MYYSRKLCRHSAAGLNKDVLDVNYMELYAQTFFKYMKNI